jgi:hypothetical protein
VNVKPEWELPLFILRLTVGVSLAFFAGSKWALAYAELGKSKNEKS